MRHRPTIAVAGTLLAVAALLGVAGLSPALAHEAGARHRWNAHMFPHAQNDFYTQAEVDALLEEPAPPPPPAEDDETDAPADDETGTDDDETVVLFPWVNEGGFQENWWAGLGYALLGILGAMVTIYLFLGESLPSMGGKADYDATRLELEDLKARREKNLLAREKFARGELDDVLSERRETQDRLAEEYNGEISRLETQLTKERWRLYIVGFPMYLILGGAFAILFATNPLQAVLVGFGWTALADRVGMKRELEAKRETRTRQITELEETAAAQSRRAEEFKARAEDLQKRLTAAEQNFQQQQEELRRVLTTRAGDAPPTG